MSRRVRIALALALFALPACAPTDTGNPPNALDPGGLDAVLVMGVLLPQVQLTGAAGAVDPPEGTVTLVSLDNPADLDRGLVAADGSFGPLIVNSEDGGEVRAFARVGGELSRPVDYAYGAEAPTLAPTLDACVDVSRLVVDVGVDAPSLVEITNRCAGALDLEAGAIVGTGFSVDGASGHLEPGESVTLSFESASDAPRIATLDVAVSGERAGRARFSLVSEMR
ncbi:MAG: hypothetical protein AB7S26_26070 [Sandaracinaceae bacterium]